jgi:hypothetical protein
MSDNHHGLILDSQKMHDRLRALGLVWGDADAAFKALEDTLKSVLAQEFLGAQGSVAEREARARVSVSVREHLAAMADARKAMNAARVQYDVARVYVDLERTNASGQRALVELR